MSTNDDKIKNLLTAVESKRASLGQKPKAVWESNCVIPVEHGVNLNTVNKISVCVTLAAQLLTLKLAEEKAAEFLGVEASKSEFDSYLNDLKLKVQILKYDAEKKKLMAMEQKLKDLRSEDAKTADALNELMADLDV